MRVAVTVMNHVGSAGIAAGVEAAPNLREVVIDADAELPVVVLADLLEPRGSGDVVQDVPQIFVEARLVEPSLSLRDAGLVDGAMFELGGTRGRKRGVDPCGLLALDAVAGVGAGDSWSLGPGYWTLGDTDECSVRIGSLSGSGTVLELHIDARLEARVRTLAIEETPTLGGQPVPENFVPWQPECHLAFGPLLLGLRSLREPDAALAPVEEGGGLSFNRPPRFVRSPRTDSFKIPARPRPSSRIPWPWLAALLPAVFGVLMAVVFRSPYFLVFALLSPLMALGGALTSRRQGKRTHRDQVREYEHTVREIESDIAARYVTETLELRKAAPDPADLCAVATGPHSRLWERRPTDGDHLLLRVGTAHQPSSVVVEDLREDIEHRRRKPAVLEDVPATISLATVGVAGIAGAGTWAYDVGRWLLAQLSVLQSPQDVQFYVLTDDHDRWHWARWLPHLRPALGQDAFLLVGNDAETVGRRVSELLQVIAHRRTLNTGAGRSRPSPDFVVVLDGARRLRSFPGVVALLREGPAVGVHCICLDESERVLPEECQAVLARLPDGEVVLRRRGDAAVGNVRSDGVRDAWFEEVARAQASIRDAGDAEGDALPASARLLDVLGLEPPHPRDIRAGWAARPRSTAAVLGVGMDGAFVVDLATHGPHGLVAGTTGSGKSEFLQTLVASLAVANRPDAMNFVLVDYKGGAAFKDCVRLPHTVGMVTDLDSHLVERALTSLSAELTRRERLLADVGAKDIDDYVALLRGRPTLTAMPRLLIVIDEFASLKRELPDFVTGLVDIAQRGRSLGIHLVLATQRPSGVVSMDIRANTNLRIALRVTDTEDSTDVIDSPEAARIPSSVPGRAYVRLGATSLVPMQTARVGGRHTKATTMRVVGPFVAEVPWTTVGYPPQRPLASSDGDVEVTDLSVLVDAVREAANDLGLVTQRAPWLAPLPTSVLVAALGPGAGRVTNSGAEPGDALLPQVPWALIDLPHEQAQRPVRLDISQFGHLFIAGAPGSGRSQVLRTMAAGIADAISAADVHLFGLDCGNGALLPLVALPHTGVVVQRTDRQRVARLVTWLCKEVLGRQGVLAGLGVANIGEQRRHAGAEDRLPHLVLLLDRWESFVSTFGDQDGGKLVDQVHELLREGASVGVHLIVTGDRSLLSGRISVLTEDKWVLRLAERNDYGLAGLVPRKAPEHMPPGRLLQASTGAEAQIALLDEDRSGTAQAAALTAVAVRAQKRDGNLKARQRPMRFDALPTTLTYETAREYARAERERSMWALIGVGGDQLVALGADFQNDAPAFLVAGPARSGRSNLLAVMTHSLLDGGCDVVVLCPRRSPLSDLFKDRRGVRGCFSGTDLSEEELDEVLRPDGRDVVLVVDDGELLREAPIKTYLRDYLRDAPANRRGLLLGGNAAEVGSGFAGWQSDIRNYQRGALLEPRDVFAGELIGVRLPRSVIAPAPMPGRALVHLGSGELRAVQVPKLL